MRIESTKRPRRRQRDQVITFYSYKGGTGRTMALANVAWILASQGHTVLAIDWDLEAPGLHRYLAPFLPDPGLEESTGLIDLLVRYMVAATKPAAETTASGGTASDKPWYAGFADLSLEAEPLDWQFPDGGRVDLLGAGRQGPSYASRVNRFDWEGFYEKFGGAAFLDLAIAQARESYEYVLIDSRTGVSDTSGICTVHLPDSLIVFFTLNDQSIEGASGVAADVLQQRQDLEARRRAKQGGETTESGEAKPRRPFRIFPVATRIELAEKEKLENRRRLVRDRFSRYLGHLRSESPEDYLGRMEILYDPYYAYEEILATVADQPGTQNSVLAAMEMLTGYVTDGAVSELKRVSAARRDEARVRFEDVAARRRDQARREAPAAAARGRTDVYLSAPPDASGAEWEDVLRRRLAPYCRVFTEASLPAGSDWQGAIERAAEEASVFVFLLDGEHPPDGNVVATALARRKEGSVRAAIPVLLADVTRSFASAPLLRPFNAVDLTGDPERGLLEIESAVLAHLDISRDEDATGSVAPMPVREPTGLERAKGWVQRHGSLLGLAAIILAGWIFQSLRPEPAGEKAVRLTAASYQVADSDPTLALLLAREAVRAEATVESTKALRDAVRRSRLVKILSGHDGPVRQAAWSPDGGFVLGLGEDGVANVWDVRGGEADPFSLLDAPPASSRRGKSPRPILAGAWAGAGAGAGAAARRPEALVLVGSRPESTADPRGFPLTLGSWIAGEGWRIERELFLDVTTPPTLARLSPDLRSVFLQAEGSAFGIWNLPSGDLLFGGEGHLPAFERPWSSDGRYLAFVAKGELFVVDLVKAVPLFSGRPEGLAADLAWHPSEPRFLLALENGACYLWDVAGRPVPFCNMGGPVKWLGWRSDGSAAMVVGDKLAFLAYQVRGGAQSSIGTFQPIEGTDWLGAGIDMSFAPETVEADWSPDGSTFLAITRAGQIFVSPVRLAPNETAAARSAAAGLPRGEPVELKAPGSGEALLGAWGPESRRVLTAHRDGTIRIWAPFTETLDVDLDTSALLELADERTPRPLTQKERADYLER